MVSSSFLGMYMVGSGEYKFSFFGHTLNCETSLYKSTLQHLAGCGARLHLVVYTIISFSKWCLFQIQPPASQHTRGLGWSCQKFVPHANKMPSPVGFLIKAFVLNCEMPTISGPLSAVESFPLSLIKLLLKLTLGVCAPYYSWSWEKELQAISHITRLLQHQWFFYLTFRYTRLHLLVFESYSSITYLE